MDYVAMSQIIVCIPLFIPYTLCLCTMEHLYDGHHWEVTFFLYSKVSLNLEASHIFLVDMVLCNYWAVEHSVATYL